MEKRLLELYRQIDRAFKQVAKQFPKEFKCKLGCCDCCHAAFDVSLAEAVVIKRAFNTLGKKNKKYCLKRAQEAKRIWDRAIKNGEDISTIKVPCPLLNRDNECILYKIRPINCRSYGVPTEIHGKGRACYLSGFKAGESYPTIRLNVIHDQLLKMSMEVSKSRYQERFTIADIVLTDHIP